MRGPYNDAQVNLALRKKNLIQISLESAADRMGGFENGVITNIGDVEKMLVEMRKRYRGIPCDSFVDAHSKRGHSRAYRKIAGRWMLFESLNARGPTKVEVTHKMKYTVDIIVPLDFLEKFPSKMKRVISID